MLIIFQVVNANKTNGRIFWLHFTGIYWLLWRKRWKVVLHAIPWILLSWGRWIALWWRQVVNTSILLFRGSFYNTEIIETSYSLKHWFTPKKILASVLTCSLWFFIRYWKFQTGQNFYSSPFLFLIVDVMQGFTKWKWQNQTIQIRKFILNNNKSWLVYDLLFHYYITW